MPVNHAYLPWAEKYRPISLDDLVGNPIVKTQLKMILEDGNLPHMILSGPPGTGKTSSVLCIAHELLGDKFEQAFLELNASDDRGIETVRNKIKDFCQKMVKLPDGKHKIIFLDEADSLTVPAQQALRRIIEINASTTRFIMTCNSSVQLIDAIQSRCTIVKFKKIDENDMLERLINICTKEHIKYSKEALRKLSRTSDGDMRTLLNNLQLVARIFGKITNGTVEDILSYPSSKDLKNLLDTITKLQFKESIEIINKFLDAGYTGIEVIKSLFDILSQDTKLDDDIKMIFLEDIGDFHYRLILGTDSRLQLQALVSRIINKIKNSKINFNLIDNKQYNSENNIENNSEDNNQEK